MHKSRNIPFEQFTVQIANPVNRLTSTCVMIHEDGRFNMNTRLAGSLGGKKVSVSFTADMRHFALKEEGDANSIYFPKSGSKRLEEISSLLRDNKIAFPAKYDVWLNESGNFWQGDLSANPTQLPSARRHSSKKS